jgi:hypothetical protein
MIPTIDRVEVKDNYRLEVRFRRPSETKIVSVKPYLNKGIFKELQNENYFRKVRIIFGGIEWPHKQDLSAETLYVRGKSIKGPSRRSSRCKPLLGER